MKKYQEERVGIIDSFVRLCIKEENIDCALTAASLGASKETIGHLVNTCLNKNSLEEAIEAVEIRPSRETITSLVKFFLATDSSTRSKLGDDILEIISSSELAMGVGIIDSLVKTFIEDKHDRMAIEAAKLGASRKTRNSLIESCIERDIIIEGDPLSGLGPHITYKGGRHLTKEEIEKTRRFILDLNK